MSTLSEEILRQQIQEDWQGNQAKFCNDLLTALLAGELDLENITTFHDLMDFVHVTDGDIDTDPIKEVLKLVPYITGARTHLLEMRMYFKDETGRHELSEAQMREVSKCKILHPLTGIELDYVEASKNVFMYFVASELIRGLKNV